MGMGILLDREQLLEDLRRTYAICTADPRLDELDGHLKQLDAQSNRIVHAISSWALRFGRFIIDEPRAASIPMARPIFVWGGRDYLERIPTDLAELRGPPLSVSPPGTSDMEQLQPAGSLVA